jgi:hypothetical protein
VRRFNEILKRYNIVAEAGEGPAAMSSIASALPPAPGEQGAVPAAPAGQETIDNQQPTEPTTKQLQPENYVMLVKLLKAAFLASPSEEDAAAVNDLKFTGPDGNETDEVNETNADEAFNKILPILSKYMSQDKSVVSLLKKV